MVKPMTTETNHHTAQRSPAAFDNTLEGARHLLEVMLGNVPAAAASAPVEKLESPNGSYVEITYHGVPSQAFVPNPLPPQPDIQFNGHRIRLIEQAAAKLSELNNTLSASSFGSSDFDNLNDLLVVKEGIASSEIEGIYARFADVLAHQAGVSVADSDIRTVEDVAACASAQTKAMKQHRKTKQPTQQLLLDAHKTLLHADRHADFTPGKYREHQCWIGGRSPVVARFVPPPPDRVTGCMDDLERYMTDATSDLPLLCNVGLAHAQFESIHPFLDGNGRVGRILIQVLLAHNNVFEHPLPLSVFFNKNRQDYYNALNRIRYLTDGWEEWLEFFLTGLCETADQTMAAAERFQQARESDWGKLMRQNGDRMPRGSLMHAYRMLADSYVTSVDAMVNDTNWSARTARAAFDELCDMKLAEPLAGADDGTYWYPKPAEAVLDTWT